MSWHEEWPEVLTWLRSRMSDPRYREDRRRERRERAALRRLYREHWRPKGKHGRRRTRREDRMIVRWIMQGRIDVEPYGS